MFRKVGFETLQKLSRIFLQSMSNSQSNQKLLYTTINQRIVEKTLSSLPVKYEHIVAVIEESKDLGKVTIDSSLEAQE